jgi:hypothetical protein
MKGPSAGWFAAGLALLVSLILVPQVVSAGISVSVFPETTFVAPDEAFTIYLWIDEAGDEFDAYETVVSFDPTRVDLISAAEESVMTDPCGNRWWQTNIGESSIFISHAFLCPGVSTTGPGALSSLNFVALQSGTSEIVFDYVDFFLSGILNQATVSRNGIVTVTGGSGVPEGDLLEPRGQMLNVYPNPAGDLVTIRFNVGRTGPASLGLFDVRGRRVFDLVPSRIVEAGTHSVRWPPPDVSVDLSRGVYFWRLLTGEGQVVRRMILND